MWQTPVLTVAPLLLSFAVAQQPGDMYDAIAKPDWTPPPYVFPIVWTFLYLSMGYASARVAGTVGLVSIPLLVYLVQLMLNVSWTPVFFGQGDFTTALTILRALLFAAIATTVMFWNVDTTAGVLFLPYIGWLLVAHELNRGIVRLNPN